MARGKVVPVEKVIEALKVASSVTEAARALDCHRATIYNKAKKDIEVAELIVKKGDELLELAEAKITQAVSRGEAWAVALVLKTRGKKRGWTERTELTGPNGGPIKTDDVSLTDEERIKRIVALLDRARERRNSAANTQGT